jgi:tetratricopeptide (TPR) repeat protein
MMQKFLILALSAGLLVAATGCSKLEARDNLNKGVRAFKSNDFEGAAKLFKKAVELDPSLDIAEVYLATAYFRQFDKDTTDEAAAKNAIEMFEKALKRNPADRDAVAGIAGVYQRKREFEKAREYYLKQTEVDPKDVSAFYAVASLDWTMASPQSGAYNKEEPPPDERQAQWVDEGLLYVDKALALNPDYEEAQTYKNLLFREKARLAEKAGKPDEQALYTKQADEWFDKAVATRKKNAEKDKQPGVVVGK